MSEDENGIEMEKITLSDMYRENWEHVRHIENERLGFTSVYIVIVAGVLAFLGQKGMENEFSSYLVWLLVFLSLVGALICVRLRADMNAHGKKLKSLAEGSRLSDYFTFGAESGWTTYIKLRTLFPLIYLICTLFFLYFALNMPSSSPKENVTTTSVENGSRNLPDRALIKDGNIKNDSANKANSANAKSHAAD